ncbi:hypothetical protein VKT23_010647 [Stygiomarasmius scandens]|uniref:Uncharacterized protein n=1 Tax=Marasmiellus scandens TaxID=2682957 RepID=A0ABR1JDF4_9AGAR
MSLVDVQDPPAAINSLLERFRVEWKKRSTVGQRKAWYKETGSKFTCTACIKRGTSCSQKSDNDTLATTARCSSCLTWKTVGCSREDDEKRYRIKSTLGLTDETYDELLGKLKEEGRAAKAFSLTPSPNKRQTNSGNVAPKAPPESGRPATQAGSSPNLVGAKNPTVPSISSPSRTTRSVTNQLKSAQSVMASPTRIISLPSTPRQTALKSEPQTPRLLRTNPPLSLSPSVTPSRKRKREPPATLSTSPSLSRSGTAPKGRVGAITSPKSPTQRFSLSGRPGNTTIKLLPKSPTVTSANAGVDVQMAAPVAPLPKPNSKTDTSLVEAGSSIATKPETRSPEMQTEVVQTRTQTTSLGMQTEAVQTQTQTSSLGMQTEAIQTHTLAVQTELTSNKISQLHSDLERKLSLEQRIRVLEREAGAQTRVSDGLRFDLDMKEVVITDLGLKLLESQRRCGDLERQNSELARKEKERQVVRRVDFEVQVEVGKEEREEMERKLELKDLEISTMQERLEAQVAKAQMADVETQTVSVSSEESSLPMQAEDIDILRPPSRLGSVLGEPDAAEILANRSSLSSVASREKAEYTYINFLRVEHEKLKEETVRLYQSLGARRQAEEVEELFQGWSVKLLDIANRRLEIAEMIVPCLQSSEGAADEEEEGEQYEGGVGDVEELPDEVDQGQYIEENEAEMGDLVSENNVDFEERVNRVVTEIAMLQAQEVDEWSESSADLQLMYPEEEDMTFSGDLAIAGDRDGVAESNDMENTDSTRAEVDNVEEDGYKDLRMFVDAVWDDEHEDPKGGFEASVAGNFLENNSNLSGSELALENDDVLVAVPALDADEVEDEIGLREPAYKKQKLAL